MSSDAPFTLELILFEMHMRTSDLVHEGFAGSLSRAVDELDCVLLFNVRLEDDEPYQRCAAVLLGQKQEDECVALAFLSKDGLWAMVENAQSSQHPLAAKALRERIGADPERGAEERLGPSPAKRTSGPSETHSVSELEGVLRTSAQPRHWFRYLRLSKAKDEGGS